jgi:GPI-anchor transamidase subunit T
VDAFTEEVLFRPLADGHALVHFHFAQASRAADLHSAAWHSQGFPRSVAELLLSTGVHSFSLTLARGPWLTREWGDAPVAAPPGAALTALWSNQSLTAPHRQSSWRRLAHGLGGVLCASLGGIARPGEWFEPHVSLAVQPGQRVAFSQLAREPVCTENLAPWLNLLPCNDAAGVAALLRSRTAVLGARHVALSMTARAQGGHAPTLALTLTLVLRPPEGMMRLSLLQLLSVDPKQKMSGCLATKEAHVLVAVPEHAPWKLDAPSSEHSDGAAHTAVTAFDVTSGRGDLHAVMHNTAELTWSPREVGGVDGVSHAAPPAVGVPRWSVWSSMRPESAGWWAAGWLSGQGDARRGLVLDLFREALPASTSEPLQVTLLQLVPHWCRLEYHTLVVTADGTPLLSPSLRVLPASALNMVPPRVRTPGLFDLQVVVPPNTTHIQLRIQFRVAFGRLDDFPPDVNRGIDIPPARWAVKAPGHSSPCTQQSRPLHCLLTHAGVPGSGDAHNRGGDPRDAVLYTGGLLLSLPSPDASMPFNVVCFVGTAIALLHASMLATLTRRQGFAARAEKARKLVENIKKAHRMESPRMRLLRRLRSILRRGANSAPWDAAEHDKKAA